MFLTPRRMCAIRRMQISADFWLRSEVKRNVGGLQISRLMRPTGERWPDGHPAHGRRRAYLSFAPHRDVPFCEVDTSTFRYLSWQVVPWESDGEGPYRSLPDDHEVPCISPRTPALICLLISAPRMHAGP